MIRGSERLNFQQNNKLSTLERRWRMIRGPELLYYVSSSSLLPPIGRGTSVQSPPTAPSSFSLATFSVSMVVVMELLTTATSLLTLIFFLFSGGLISVSSIAVLTAPLSSSLSGGASSQKKSRRRCFVKPQRMEVFT